MRRLQPSALRVLLAIPAGVCGLTPLVARAATGPNDQVTFYGLGTLSCATWQSDQVEQNRGNQWIFGYFSAVNLWGTTRGSVGGSTDQPGLVAEVKKQCDARPSAQLWVATDQVYRAMLARGQ